MSTDPTPQFTDLYNYCGGNPISLADPDGGWAGWDDAAAMGGGALLGLGSQLISDLAAGEMSGWQDYSGAAIGGAVAGEVLLYTGNAVLAGAAGGAAGSVTGLALKGESLLSKSSLTTIGAATTIGAVTGGITGKSIKGITAGKNSYTAIAKQMETKLAKGQISKISSQTGAKMATGKFVKGAMVEGAIAGGVISGELRNQVH